MIAPLKIFISYKKKLLEEKDGKFFEHENYRIEVLEFIFSQANQTKKQYDVWIDKTALGAGVAWETEIYRRIIASDIMLVLVGPGTSQSQWVQREIALANALGIAIVPIGSGTDFNTINTETKALGIDHLQCKITQNITLKTGDALIDELRGDLESAAKRTKQQQDEVLHALMAQRRIPDSKAPDNQRAATYVLNRKDRSINLHIASGDISKVRGIDVLVNSENDYMQMARFFESKTLSSMLRRLGSSIRDGKYEDTIQRELDWQLRERGRPVQAGEVFVTSSGGPSSELAKRIKARYILHVAAVQAVDAANTVIPYKQPHQIEECVRASLAKIAEINGQLGLISPPGSEQYAEQERVAKSGNGKVQSVIFPLFGSGQGGNPTAEVLGPMFSGIEGFFHDPEGVELGAVMTDIYISAFKERDVEELTNFLSEKFS